MVFGLFGIIFISLGLHEMTHVLQSSKANEICYDFNQPSLMHVSHDVFAFGSNGDSAKENFTRFVEKTERDAHLIENGIGYLLALLFGASVASVSKKK
jgi:hypothetical protein